MQHPTHPHPIKLMSILNPYIINPTTPPHITQLPFPIIIQHQFTHILPQYPITPPQITHILPQYPITPPQITHTLPQFPITLTMLDIMYPYLMGINIIYPFNIKNYTPQSPFTINPIMINPTMQPHTPIIHPTPMAPIHLMPLLQLHIIHTGHMVDDILPICKNVTRNKLLLILINNLTALIILYNLLRSHL